MNTQVEFRSDKFPAYEGEEELINPGIHGKRLAEFLATGLPAQGFETEKLIAEDWGWIVPIKNPAFKLWIGCANYGEIPGGFLCFIEPHTPTVRKLFSKIETQPRIEALQLAMDTILSEAAGIREKKWWTYEDFNHPQTG